MDSGYLLPDGSPQEAVAEILERPEAIKSDHYFETYVNLLHYIYRTSLPVEEFSDSTLALLSDILHSRPRTDTAPVRANPAYLPMRSIKGMKGRDMVKVYSGYFFPDRNYYREKGHDIECTEKIKIYAGYRMVIQITEHQSQSLRAGVFSILPLSPLAAELLMLVVIVVRTFAFLIGNHFIITSRNYTRTNSIKRSKKYSGYFLPDAVFHQQGFFYVRKGIH